MSLRELLNAPEDDVISEHMETDLLTVNESADPELAAREFADYDFPALPVIDDRGRFVGIIRTEEMLDVVEEEEVSEDILKSAGVTFTDVEVSRSSAIPESSVSRRLHHPVGDAQARLRPRGRGGPPNHDRQ